MNIWMACDAEGSDAEEQCAALYAAESAASAEAMWRRAFGYEDDADVVCQVTPAVWQWPDVPEPVPTRPGPWDDATLTPHGKMFRGFGFWEEDDPRCDECGELSPAELGMVEVDGFAICPQCAAKVGGA